MCGLRSLDQKKSMRPIQSVQVALWNNDFLAQPCTTPQGGSLTKTKLCNENKSSWWYGNHHGDNIDLKHIVTRGIISVSSETSFGRLLWAWAFQEKDFAWGTLTWFFLRLSCHHEPSWASIFCLDCWSSRCRLSIVWTGVEKSVFKRCSLTSLSPSKQTVASDVSPLGQKQTQPFTIGLRMSSWENSKPSNHCMASSQWDCSRIIRLQLAQL